MNTIRDLIGAATILVLLGWIFYASWESIQEIQANATCNTPHGTQFYEDLFTYVFMSFVRIIAIILLAIPGYLYSLCPLPKLFSEITIFACYGGGIWLILGLIDKNSLISILPLFKPNSNSIIDTPDPTSFNDANSNVISSLKGHSKYKKNLITGEMRMQDYYGKDKVGYSMQKENLFTGEKIRQKFDENKNRNGYSYIKKNLFTDEERTQNIDNEGNKTGYSQIKTKLFSNEQYIQDFDNEGNKLGHSEWKENFWTGEKYLKHFDKDGNPVD